MNFINISHLNTDDILWNLMLNHKSCYLNNMQKHELYVKRTIIQSDTMYYIKKYISKMNADDRSAFINRILYIDSCIENKLYY